MPANDDQILRSKRCVVFDLDDTLYDEIDYVASGFQAVVALLDEGLREQGRQFLAHRVATRHLRHAFEDLAVALRLRRDIKEDWIAAYHLHRPAITLRSGMTDLIDRLQGHGISMACVTDGRSVAQRAKLAALGLSRTFAHVSISEEIGVEKPAPDAFIAVAAAVPSTEYCYIADNPAKDFLAGRQLGWYTIGLANERGLRLVDRLQVSQSHAPHQWCNSVSELTNAIESWIAQT